MGCSYSQHATVAPASTDNLESLRARLVELGRHSSVELSPSQVCTEVQPKGGKLSPALCGGGASPGALPPGTPVFISMVKKTLAHFDDVAAACSSLAAAGFEPVPHCPACRFSSAEEMESTLAQLNASGATRVLALGGNDQHARAQAGAPFADAGSLIETGVLRRNGFKRVVVGGHPDGHPGLGKSVSKTADALHAKLTALTASGHAISIATQFSFDANAVLGWLHETRRFVATLGPAAVGAGVTYHIGVYGPTKFKKLRRIAEICEVPSLAMDHSLFDTLSDGLDHRHGGALSMAALLEHAQALAATPERLEELHAAHADEAGLLHRPQMASLLAELVTERRSQRCSKEAGGARVVAGPSACLDNRRISKDLDNRRISEETMACGSMASPEAYDDTEATPEELALAIAAYCEREQTAAGEVVLHWFPFGGWERCLALVGQMRDGTWPPLEPYAARTAAMVTPDRQASNFAREASPKVVSATPHICTAEVVSLPTVACSRRMPWHRAINWTQSAFARTETQPGQLRHACKLIDGKAIAETCLHEVG